MSEPVHWTCGSCRWWDPHDSVVAHAGACRVAAPQASTDNQRTFWPLTLDHDWCGSWIGKLIDAEVSDEASMSSEDGRLASYERWCEASEHVRALDAEILDLKGRRTGKAITERVKWDLVEFARKRRIKAAESELEAKAVWEATL